MTGHEYNCGEYQLQVSAEDSRAIDIGPPLTEGGGDSDVYKALIKDDGKLIAVKEVEICTTLHDSGIGDALGLLKEYQILRGTKHKNIVRYKNWSFVDGQTVVKLQLFSDFLRHDTLETRYKEFVLSERQIGLYTRHILNGISYLHGKDILHRDIRCGNIWVDDEAVCKLANFGKAKELRHRKESLTKSNSGRFHWMAPEIANQKEYGKPVDIWSLGCTILEMLTGQRPYEEDGMEVDEFKVLGHVKAGKGPTIPEYLRNDCKNPKITPTARDFVEKCLQIRPECRPTANALLQHPFIKLNRPTQHAAQVAPLSSEDSEDFEMDSMAPEEQQKAAVESQCQDRPNDLSHSVVEMCHLISKELEENASDSSVILISNDWLIKWQLDDDKVYAKLLDFGYMKTFETDTYSCFENILHTSDGGCNCCVNVQSKLDMSPELVVAPRTSQGGGHDKDSSEFIHNASSGAEMPDGVNVHDHRTWKQSLEEAGPSGEENVLTTTEAHDSKVSSMCSGDCPDIPLIIDKGKVATTSDNPRAATVKLHALKWETTRYREFKVPLALSCCVNDDQLCIKFLYFKGEIYPASAGTVLRQTVLSISAKVDDQMIILRSVDPENNWRRVCSRGKAHYEFKHGKPGTTAWLARFAPGFQVPPFGGVTLGEAVMHKHDNRVPVQVCGRGDSLDLVTLRVGHTGCSWFDFQKVLVLQRNIANTYLARENSDVTCMDSQADSRPVVLMGNLPRDSSNSDDGHRQRFIEITCCAKLEIDFIPDEMKVREVVEREMMCKVDKKHDWVSLCHNPGTEHVTFKGMVPTRM